MKDAVIFDLDGTLWDSTGCACDIWNRVFERHREVGFHMTRDRVTQLMGKTMEEIGRALFPGLDEAQQKSIMDDLADAEIEYLYQNGGVLYDALEETLKILSGRYDLYIVSNCQDGYVPAFLHAHKLHAYFKDMEMSGRTGMDKGRNIRLVMERNHIKAAVYIGDTAGDEAAARYAGIPFVWAKYGFGRAASPDGVIESIGELPELLSKLK